MKYHPKFHENPYKKVQCSDSQQSQFHAWFCPPFAAHFQNHISTDLPVKFTALLPYLEMVLFLTNEGIVRIWEIESFVCIYSVVWNRATTKVHIVMSN